MSTTKEIQDRVAAVSARATETLNQAKALLDEHQRYLDECGLEPEDAIRFLSRNPNASAQKAQALKDHEEWLSSLPNPHRTTQASGATTASGAGRHSASWKPI